MAAGNEARGHRSMALLAMYRGQLFLAVSHLKQAILINKAARYRLNEYRDHMFLAAIYRLKGRNADAISELEEADRILSKTSIDPFFISILAKAYARVDKTREVSRLLKTMTLQAGNLTAFSASNRTRSADRAAISLVTGEIALAHGKGNEAVEFFKLSCQIDSASKGCLESLAFAYRKLGKPQDAAEKYKEIIAGFELGYEMQEHWILAHHELAKIYRELGDTQKAKEYYEKLFSIWKEADSDIPLLRQAKAEYSRLQ